MYEASQQQRYIERQIRRWKREASAMDAAGLDNGYAKLKVRGWQAAQRDFINQTGFSRDYFRERAGGQNLETPTKADILKQLAGNNYRAGSPNAPKLYNLSSMVIPQTADDPSGNAVWLVPKGAMATKVKVIAGAGTSTPLRDIPRLDAEYGGDPRMWRKITAIAEGNSFRYDVHWYENSGKTYPDEIKVKNRK